MKKSLMFASAIVAMAFAVSFSSCGTKGCMEVKDDKYNAEATIEDADACDMEGTVNKFVGTFTVVEDCSGAADTYSATIAKSQVADYAVVISNFFGTTLTVNAGVSSDKITIESQTVSGFTTNGSGTINGNVINMSYTVSGTTGSLTCTSTWTKQ